MTEITWRQIDLPEDVSLLEERAQGFLSELKNTLQHQPAQFGAKTFFILRQKNNAHDLTDGLIHELQQDSLATALAERLRFIAEVALAIRSAPIHWVYLASADCLGSYWFLARFCHLRIWLDPLAVVGESEYGALMRAVQSGNAESWRQRAWKTLRPGKNPAPLTSARQAAIQGDIDLCLAEKELSPELLKTFLQHAPLRQDDLTQTLQLDPARMNSMANTALTSDFIAMLERRHLRYSNALRDFPMPAEAVKVVIDTSDGLLPTSCFVRLLQRRITCILTADLPERLKQVIDQLHNSLPAFLPGSDGTRLIDHFLQWSSAPLFHDDVTLIRPTKPDKVEVTWRGKKQSFIRLQGLQPSASVGWYEVLGQNPGLRQDGPNPEDTASVIISAMANGFIHKKQGTELPLSHVVKILFWLELTHCTVLHHQGDIFSTLQGLGDQGWTTAADEQMWDQQLKMNLAVPPEILDLFAAVPSLRFRTHIHAQSVRTLRKELKSTGNTAVKERWSAVRLSRHLLIFTAFVIRTLLHKGYFHNATSGDLFASATLGLPSHEPRLSELPEHYGASLIQHYDAAHWLAAGE